jgi:hypothetical protein
LPLNRGYEATMAQQPALQQIAEKHPSYLRVMPTPVSDAAVTNMLFLPHEIFLGTDADMREVAAAFVKVQARYQPQAIKVKTAAPAQVEARPLRRPRPPPV